VKVLANFPQLFAKNQKCTNNTDRRRYSVKEQSLSDNNEGSKCARCGGRLEDGYAMAPKGLWWDKVQHKLMWLGSGAEKIISQWRLGMPTHMADGEWDWIDRRTSTQSGLVAGRVGSKEKRLLRQLTGEF